MPQPKKNTFHAPARPPTWLDRFGKEHSVIGWLAVYAGTLIVVVGSYPAGHALGHALGRALYHFLH